MKYDPVEMSYLLDFYGNILTDKQRYYYDCYYNQDLSLSEIAENENISRQGARDVINRAGNQLRHWEESLGFVKRYAGVQQALEAMAALVLEIRQINNNRILNTEIDQRALTLLEMIHTMTQEEKS